MVRIHVDRDDPVADVGHNLGHRFLNRHMRVPTAVVVQEDEPCHRHPRRLGAVAFQDGQKFFLAVAEFHPLQDLRLAAEAIRHAQGQRVPVPMDGLVAVRTVRLGADQQNAAIAFDTPFIDVSVAQQIATAETNAWTAVGKLFLRDGQSSTQHI